MINATGVWTDELQHLVGERGKFHVTASKGVHLVVPRDRLQLDTGLILRTEKSGSRARPGQRGRRQVHDLPCDGARRGRRRGAEPRCARCAVGDHITPMIGADGYQALWNAWCTLAERSGLHVARIEHLLRRYGTCTHELMEMIKERPELAKPLPGADDCLSAEARYGASREGALHVDDILARRTRISIESWDRGEAAAETVARLMGEALDWSKGAHCP